MNETKRSYIILNENVNCNGKLDNVVSSTSHDEPNERLPEADLTNIPLIKQLDNAWALPKYSSITAKSGDEGVCMDDLDQLQQDLEKLLSTSAVRIRYLLSEIGDIDRNEDEHDRKGHNKTSLKRKRPDEKPKLKDLKPGMRIIKKHYGVPEDSNLIGKYRKWFSLKTIIPTSSGLPSYCANINKDDVEFLDGLIEEFSREIDVRLPQLGQHYNNGWLQNNDHQNLEKLSTQKIHSNNDRKNGLHVMFETLSTPQTQRLLTALVEPSEFAKLKTPTGEVTCLDRRLKKELIEQNILNLEDLTRSKPEDEILAEIKKCQQELATVNVYNIEELSKLKAVVTKDLHSNELKEQLERVDKEVLDLYNTIVLSRKTAQEEESEEFDKTLFNQQVTRKFEAQANLLLQQQMDLNQEINVSEKSADYGVSMEYLDNLQQDLEKRLTTNAIQIRNLLLELEKIDGNDDDESAKRTHNAKALKTKRTDDIPQHVAMKPSMRVLKKQYELPMLQFPQGTRTVNVPNHNSNHFWGSTEPFSTIVNKDDVMFLNDLLQEFSREVDVKIPKMENYSNGWSEKIIKEEPCLDKSPNKTVSSSSDKENGINVLFESLSAAQTERLLASFIEPSEYIKKKASNGIIACRLKKEQIEEDVPNIEYSTKKMPEDEILAEISKCQRELVSVNSYNREGLTKLKSVVLNDFETNELKEELEKVDNEVLDLYNKIVMSRKAVQQKEGGQFDNTLFNKEITNRFEAQASALINQQIDLNRQINGLKDVHMLY